MISSCKAMECHKKCIATIFKLHCIFLYKIRNRMVVSATTLFLVLYKNIRLHCFHKIKDKDTEFNSCNFINRILPNKQNIMSKYIYSSLIFRIFAQIRAEINIIINLLIQRTLSSLSAHKLNG